MATRSRIGIECPDGSVRSIYCHNDGYPSHNGKILNDHYTTREKVEELIELGDISVLKKDVTAPEGASHTFDRPYEDVTVAYCRDRGEEYSAPRKDASLAKFLKSDYEEYGYVFTLNNEWVVCQRYASGAIEFEPLTDVLESGE